MVILLPTFGLTSGQVFNLHGYHTSNIQTHQWTGIWSSWLSYFQHADSPVDRYLIFMVIILPTFRLTSGQVFNLHGYHTSNIRTHQWSGIWSSWLSYFQHSDSPVDRYLIFMVFILPTFRLTSGQVFNLHGYHTSNIRTQQWSGT